MSIPQEANSHRHVALYSCFLLLLFAGTTSGTIRGGGYGARRSESGESAERKKKETDSLSPSFAPFCATRPSRGGGRGGGGDKGTRSRALGFLTAGNHHRRLVRPVPSRDVLSLSREGGQARVRPPTTFTGEATGEDRLPAAAATATADAVVVFLTEDTPGKRFRIQEERTRKEWEQGSDRRRHAPLRLRYFV